MSNKNRGLQQDTTLTSFYSKKKNYELKKLKKFRIEKHINRKFEEMTAQREQ